jgi:hypothetical protein
VATGYPATAEGARHLFAPTQTSFLTMAQSLSKSNLDEVETCIANQEAHHARVSFQDEFRAFLKRYEIEYDEKYVWD